jgi:hypothetical protein
LSSKCPEFRILVAAAEDRSGPEVRAHLETCAACRDAVAETRALHTAIATLGAADRATVSAGFTARVEARLARPGLAVRLPLAVAAAWRSASAFLQPAVVGGLAATIAGLVLGTWFGVTTQRGTSESLATPYNVSTLVDDEASTSLASDYFANDETSPASGSSAVDPSDATDSAPDAGSNPGGAVPAQRDSQGGER